MRRNIDDAILKSERKHFPINSNKAVIFGKEERIFIYDQLSARKIQLNDELMIWAEQKDTKEILRVSGLINDIQSVMNKLIG